MSKTIPEAEIEIVTYALAKCPDCDAEHDVPILGSGTIICENCETEFFWQVD